jgi:hypothetical protein
MMKNCLLALLATASLFGLQNPSPHQESELTEVFCPAGTILPLNLNISGEVLEAHLEEPLPLKILIDCHVRYGAQGPLLFSQDRINWKPFEEMFTGNISLSIDPDHGATSGSLETELHLR